jgi:hypothetical protein
VSLIEEGVHWFPWLSRAYARVCNAKDENLELQRVGATFKEEYSHKGDNQDALKMDAHDCVTVLCLQRVL